jgi:hypothetical protein
MARADRGAHVLYIPLRNVHGTHFTLSVICIARTLRRPNPCGIGIGECISEEVPVTTSTRRFPRLRPSSNLVAHDIRVTREELQPGAAHSVATVHCERYDRTVEVEDCGYCERFARIDTHEAGYVMLCRSSDEAVSRRSPK